MKPTPNITAIVLAAGRSTRMGAANKLLADVAGRPMVRWVVEAALASRTRPVLVVTGHQAAEVAKALTGLEVSFVANTNYSDGLATSLKAGLSAVPQGSDGAMVLLGDMPQITGTQLDRLVAAFEAERGAAIIVPTCNGRRGNPVVWPRAYFAQMLQLEGDAGAKRLLSTHAGNVREVDLGSEAIFADVDTPEALAQVRQERKD